MRTKVSEDNRKKEKILSLGRRGFSYVQICKRLNVSKGSVSYHLGEGQKEKTRLRNAKCNDGMFRKMSNFQTGRKEYKERKVTKTEEIRKKGKNFLRGNSRTENYHEAKAKLKYAPITIWDYFNKIWPGIVNVSKEDVRKKNVSLQAINQWTGLPDKEKGIPVMFPMVRCKLTDEIVNAEYSNVHCDHIDGDRRNNHAENFSLVLKRFNEMKGQDTYEDFYKNCKKFVEVYEKYNV